MSIDYGWRGQFTNAEINALHAEAFETRVYGDAEWDWVSQVNAHSLGWVVARRGGELVGFVNVVWDGLVHAWLHVDFDPDLATFYIDACGFTPTSAGLIEL